MNNSYTRTNFLIDFKNQNFLTLKKHVVVPSQKQIRPHTNASFVSFAIRNQFLHFLEWCQLPQQNAFMINMDDAENDILELAEHYSLCSIATIYEKDKNLSIHICVLVEKCFHNI